MKRYGANKATVFYKSQINYLYKLAKQDQLKIEKWVMSDFYYLADYYGYDDNGSVEDAEREVLKILDAAQEDLELTQELINKYTEHTFSLLSNKNKAKSDRNYI